MKFTYQLVLERIIMPNSRYYRRTNSVILHTEPANLELTTLLNTEEFFIYLFFL